MNKTIKTVWSQAENGRSWTLITEEASGLVFEDVYDSRDTVKRIALSLCDVEEISRIIFTDGQDSFFVCKRSGIICKMDKPN